MMLAVGGIGIEQVAMGKGLTPAALAAIAKDPMSLFASRSPGARAEGALMLTKQKHEIAPPSAPGDSAEQKFPPAFPAIEENPPIETAHPVEAAWETNPPPPEGEVPPLASLGLISAPIPETPDGYPSDVPPGGGGGGGGGCCTTITEGVPEPSTWAMLIIGFFSIGHAMRARRRSAKLVDGVRA